MQGQSLCACLCQKEKKMKCSGCNLENESGAKFCKHCGAELSAQTVISSKSSPPPMSLKPCKTCGEHIHRDAEICPKCGVRQGKMLDKAILLLITFFLGGIGGHKFYLRQTGLGFVYLLFFWTSIPGLIALIEFIIYACTDTEELREKYPTTSGKPVVIAICCMGIIPIIGILAAIAIPNFLHYQEKAKAAEVKQFLGTVSKNQEAYFSEYDSYTDDVSLLGMKIPPGIDYRIETDAACYKISATKENIKDIWIMDCNLNLQAVPKQRQ